jgi:hypothetical protein
VDNSTGRASWRVSLTGSAHSAAARIKRATDAQVLLAGTGAADALLILDLPDPRGRAFAQCRKAPAEFAATGAAVRQQPVARLELVIHSPQALDPLLRCITAEFSPSTPAGDRRRRWQSAFLVLAEHHGQHRAVAAGQLWARPSRSRSWLLRRPPTMSGTTLM